jgi:chromosome segregation ATPase
MNSAARGARASQLRRPTVDKAKPKSAEIPRFGFTKAIPEVKPSQIHEIRIDTQRIQTQIRLQQTKLYRLRQQILNRTEAIERTVKQKSTDQSSTGHQSTISALQQSITACENTVAQLHVDIEAATEDDRTAVFHELDEELKTTYLEYDRLQGDIEASKKEASDLEVQLRETDSRASPQHLSDLEREVSELKIVNVSLRKKWRAYQIKMEKLKIEARIVENRQAQIPSSETLEAASREHNADMERLKNLADAVEADDNVYQQNVQELAEIIQRQRQKLVSHIVGPEEPGQ